MKTKLLIAEIRRKLADLEDFDTEEEDVVERLRALLKETKEDLLTSDVFGAIKYLPRYPYLQTVFETIGRRNSHATLFRDCMIKLGENIKSLQFDFWPTYPTPIGLKGITTEPDLQIANEQILIFFEAKLHSGFGELQIERELAVGLEQAGDRDFFLVLVTPNFLQPLIRSEKRRIPVLDYLDSIVPSPEISEKMVEKIKRNSDRVLWVSWQAIISALDESRLIHSEMSSVRDEEFRSASEMLEDLKALLEMRGISPLKGFECIAALLGKYEVIKYLPWITVSKVLHFQGINLKLISGIEAISAWAKDSEFSIFPWVYERSAYKKAVQFHKLEEMSLDIQFIKKLFPWKIVKAFDTTRIVKESLIAGFSVQLFPWKIVKAFDTARIVKESLDVGFLVQLFPWRKK